MIVDVLDSLDRAVAFAVGSYTRRISHDVGDVVLLVDAVEQVGHGACGERTGGEVLAWFCSFSFLGVV